MPRLIGQGNSRSWSEEHLKILERMWSEGKTGSEIAAVLPHSRCAVCAMARRRNLVARQRGGPGSRAKKLRAPRRPAIHSSIVARMEQAIDLVADYNFPLREAAEKSNVPFHQLRGYFTFLLGKFDKGEPATARDDVVRPRHA